MRMRMLVPRPRNLRALLTASLMNRGTDRIDTDPEAPHDRSLVLERLQLQARVREERIAERASTPAKRGPGHQTITGRVRVKAQSCSQPHRHRDRQQVTNSTHKSPLCSCSSTLLRNEWQLPDYVRAALLQPADSSLELAIDRLFEMEFMERGSGRRDAEIEGENSTFEATESALSAPQQSLQVDLEAWMSSKPLSHDVRHVETAVASQENESDSLH